MYMGVSMKQLVFVDSDGTLKNSNGVISDKTKKTLTKLKDSNVEIVITTGRPRYHALKVKNESNASRYIISSNGAEVYDDEINMVIYASYLDKDDILKVFDVANKFNARCIMTIDDKEVVTDVIKNEHQVMLDKDLNEYLDNHKVKQLFIRSDNEKEAIKAYESIKDIGNVKIANESSFFQDGVIERKGIWFSVTNKSVNKGNAILELCKHLNVDIINTYGFGNDYNDIEMFDTVNYSIVMDNASKDLKDKAKFIAKSNDEDGVARLLESLFLK